MAAEGRLVLGIDMGTTSVKVFLYDTTLQKSLGSWSRNTSSYVNSDIGDAGREQDVARIISTLQLCIKEDVPVGHLERVCGVGVCGQMHGVVLWRKGYGWTWEDGGVSVDGRHVVSHLYTWEDSRCDAQFISSLPKPATHLRQSTGYGCSTLFWLSRNRKEYLDGFDCCGTIQDFVVTMLCGLSAPVMSIQNAASWGYFNTVHQEWNTELLTAVGFPVTLLPHVVRPGTVVGQTSSNWFGLPCGVAVLAAMGDLQCSILSTLQKQTDAIMNISTSAQLTIRMPHGFTPPQDVDNSKEAIEYVPYFDGYYLAEAPSLNGGNVFANFVKTIQHWTQELGVEMTDEEIWKRINEIEQSIQSQPSPITGAGDSLSPPLNRLTIRPTVYGERHLISETGSAQSLTATVTSLRDIYTAMSAGIVTNLREMMPVEFLLHHGINRIIGSGTALAKNRTMQLEVERQFGAGLTLQLGQSGDSAVGAAIAAFRALVQKSEEIAGLRYDC